MPSTCGNDVSMFFYFIDTLNHDPANAKQGLAAAGAVQALFKCGDKGVASGINFVFNTGTKSFHYDGANWREITKQSPKSPEAIEAQKRLASLQEKMEKKS